MTKPAAFALFSCVVFFCACSSAPQRPAEVFANRNTAANHLNLANQNAGQGRFEDALFILEEAWRLALAADDPALRINTAISRGSILFSLNRHDEAFREWESASAEGEASSLPLLAARARIYAIRARLVLLSGENPEGGDGAAQELKTQVLAEIAAVRADPVSSAAGFVTLGMAEKQLRHWTEAENAVARALPVHERNRMFEDAAYDWFVIASIRSVAGKHNAALEALTTAIQFDRRAENAFGLASSWQAMGAVYQNAGRTEESRAAYRRSADIYRAIGLDSHAEEIENLLK